MGHALYKDGGKPFFKDGERVINLSHIQGKLRQMVSPNETAAKVSLSCVPTRTFLGMINKIFNVTERFGANQAAV